MTEDRATPGELLAWREEYALGVPGVDHEHRELIGMINDAWTRGTAPGASPVLTEELLGELLSRISAHFALEERLMREAHYDDYGPHKRDHEVLLDRLRDIMDDVAGHGHGHGHGEGEGEGYAAAQLGRDLDDWFVGHFRTHDARLHHRLQG